MFRILGHRIRSHSYLSIFFTPRNSLIFGPQTPVQYTLNTIKVALFGHLIWDHFYSIRRAHGPSMLPTLNIDGDMILHSKLYALGKGVKLGDLVSYIHPREPDALILKRVVGMPGDFVVLDPEGEVEGFGDGVGMMVQVPQGHCWVAGDNLLDSIDSRKYGPLPLGLIQGKAIARVFPNPKWLGGELEPVQAQAKTLHQ